MNASITKIFRFEAAHRLPDHDGQCRNLHGHTYKVEITISGNIQTSGPQNGMVLDFGHISKIWKSRLEPRLDHQYLNETIDPTPTAERLSIVISTVMTDGLNRLSVEGLELISVRVWETETAYAEYFGD